MTLLYSIIESAAHPNFSYLYSRLGISAGSISKMLP